MSRALLLPALIALAALAVAPTPGAAPPLRGGVEVEQPAERAPRPPGGQRRALCEAYASQVPAGARLHVMPKAIPQGRPQEGRCIPPDPAWATLGEDGNYCCYSTAAGRPPLSGGTITVDDPGVRPPDRPQYVPPYVPPQVPPYVPPPTPPQQPPPALPPADPGYWAGVQAGFVSCGQSVATMIQALQHMARGDFVTAAQLLGATDSGAGLRALWAQLSDMPAIDRNGRRLTAYEIGKRQAERICLYALVPEAQKCAVRGTACAVRTAGAACQAVYQRISQLRPIRLPIRLPPPPTPLFRGLLLVDENFLRETAISDGLVFIVRDSNRWSMRWIGRDGYGPKPLGVKGKTLKPEDLAHLPAAEAERYAGLASARGMSEAARAELRGNGYSIGSAAEQEIIRGPGGRNGFYSDTDLHGVYKLGGGQGWTPELRARLDCHFFERGVQHGPHDLWPLRNNAAAAGPNYGPQVGPGKGLTAYLPDGSAVHIESLAQMKAFYRAIGVDFNAIYPGH